MRKPLDQPTTRPQGMTVADRLRQFLASHEDVVFIRREFGPLGSSAQVGRALRRLVDEGELVRLGLGIYAKTKPSVLSGKPIPAHPVDVLAPLALRKLGIEVGPSRLVRAYNEGRSTQIPAGIVFSTGGRRITRKIGFNHRLVRYEYD